MASGTAAEVGSRLSDPNTAATVVASDGAPLAVHDLSGGVDAPPLLVSHATGFCAHAYAPIGAALAGRLRAFGIDHRGHGATPPPPGWDETGAVDWRIFGADTVTVAQYLAPEGGLIGFGHSMGGASLLMAAHADPSRFARLVLFEPIVLPEDRSEGDIADSPLVVGARRRRPRFDSCEQAYENFRGKPPLSVMTPESLRGYVEHGLRPAPDGGVELCCAPEVEAATFMGSRTNGVWELLPEIEVPVRVLAGRVEPEQPAALAPLIAERLPRGELVELPHQTHLGPFSHPAEVAELIVG